MTNEEQGAPVGVHIGRVERVDASSEGSFGIVDPLSHQVPSPSRTFDHSSCIQGQCATLSVELDSRYPPVIGGSEVIGRTLEIKRFCCPPRESRIPSKHGLSEGTL
jgi:hypothetical protein